MTANTNSRKVFAVVGFWLVAAIAVSASDVLYAPPRPVLPLLVWAPVMAFLMAYAGFPGLRRRVLSLNVRSLIAFHFVRAPIGIGFLVLGTRGDLPAEFAHKAGIGDIVVGLAAVALVAGLPPLATAAKPRAVLLWNALGLADIIMVMIVAQRLIFTSEGPNPLVQLSEFPFLVILSFVVPMVFITHLAIFAQAWRKRVARVPAVA